MKKVFQGIVYSVWQYEQTMYDGSKATFEKISRKDYACAIGVLPDKRILLIEDTQPDRNMVITPAGGGVEDSEKPIEAAQRELLEETGYSTKNIIPFFSYQSHARMQCTCHFFIARDIKKTSEPKLEAGEKVKPILFSFDEFLELGKNSHVRDLMLRIKLLEALLDSKKRAELEKLFYGN